MTGIADRREDRRRRMVVNRAVDFQAAEDWDLDFRLSPTPRRRLSVLVAMRNVRPISQEAAYDGSLNGKRTTKLDR